MSTIRLIIVRHGETTANALNIIQGQTDVPLNERGVQQAARVAEALKDEKFDAVYSSDLSRAMTTARAIVPEGEITALPALREWHLGVWQGKDLDRIKKDYPEIYAGVYRGEANLRIPGGETRNELRQRIKDFLESLPAKHPEGGKILMVSHGGAIRALFRVLVGENNIYSKPPEVGNCSISRFLWEGDSWQLISWNEEGHLKGLNVLETRY